MNEGSGADPDETAPIAGTYAHGADAATYRQAATPPPGPTTPVTVPAVYAPSPPPVATTPAGWYPLNGEQHYWDGARWTGHRAPVAIPARAPAYRPALVTDAHVRPVEVAFAWIFTVITVGYMLPWAIAATRGKSNSWAVGLVNFLLGWTFIGWVVALVMACTAHQVAAVQHRY